MPRLIDATSGLAVGAQAASDTLATSQALQQQAERHRLEVRMALDQMASRDADQAYRSALLEDLSRDDGGMSARLRVAEQLRGHMSDAAWKTFMRDVALQEKDEIQAQGVQRYRGVIQNLIANGGLSMTGTPGDIPEEFQPALQAIEGSLQASIENGDDVAFHLAQREFSEVEQAIRARRAELKAMDLDRQWVEGQAALIDQLSPEYAERIRGALGARLGGITSRKEMRKEINKLIDEAEDLLNTKKSGKERFGEERQLLPTAPIPQPRVLTPQEERRARTSRQAPVADKLQALLRDVAILPEVTPELLDALIDQYAIDPTTLTAEEQAALLNLLP